MQERPLPVCTSSLSTPPFKIWIYLALSVWLVFSLGLGTTFALDRQEVLLVINDSSPESQSLGAYYKKARNIPDKNVIHILCTNKESIPRSAFERDMVSPLKKALKSPGLSGTIKCLLLTYGIPLRIHSSENEGNPGASPKNKGKHAKEKGLRSACASVDSELMTLKIYGQYPLRGWIPSPLFLGGKRSKRALVDAEKILMVSRIDGPDLLTAKRIVANAINAEKEGLRGSVCLDCRYASKPEGAKKENTYQIFDRWILDAGNYFKSKGMKVSIELGPGLFKKGQCEGCALYCGWYSLGHYVDSCTWAKGAIAYHIASGECASLHGQNRQWCRMLLKKGVSVTIGPVAEPYLQAFPPPNIFFRLLFDYRLPIAQAYLLSTPMLSWRMVLIGDPLYRPFVSTYKSTK